MSGRKSRASDPRQGVFGSFGTPATVVAIPAETGATVDADQAMREAVADTPNAAARCATGARTREQGAEAMTAALGRRVSKVQLDQWSARSQEDRRIPADAPRALGQTTGDWRALHVLVKACGFSALTPQEAVCAEFGALFTVRRRIDQRAKELTGDMEDLVGSLMARMKEQIAS